MNLLIVTPAGARSQKGNRVTAARWARRLEELGHTVRTVTAYGGENIDLLIALHARKSAPSVADYRRDHPRGPLIVALTGTDLYADLPAADAPFPSLEQADRIVTLHPRAADELPPRLAAKCRHILQSAVPVAGIEPPVDDAFEVCVLGHLRPVKDPFRAAEASRRMPAESRLKVLHIGAALTAEAEARARQEEATNPRYRWLGELPREAALRRLAGCRLMVLSSRLEGGANVVSEAVVHSVPILASRIAGSIGLLGEDYPGYFPVEDTAALAVLLRRAEQQPEFLRQLTRHALPLRRQLTPEAERESWRGLLAEFRPAMREHPSP